MRIFRRRPRYTDADSRSVKFFFEQYVELMKHGKDNADLAMKHYVADIIHELGVPEEIEIEHEPIEIEYHPRSYPIINRRK